MGGWLGILVGALAASGTYLLLQRERLPRALGLILMSHAANLLVFAMAGGQRLAAPIVPEGASAPPALATDPLPQALVLTAIVIGFALQAFALVALLVPASGEPAQPEEVA